MVCQRGRHQSQKAASFKQAAISVADIKATGQLTSCAIVESTATAEDKKRLSEIMLPNGNLLIYVMGKSMKAPFTHRPGRQSKS